ncbi:MAG: acyl-CoA hydrolase [Halioglobus sp.]
MKHPNGRPGLTMTIVLQSLDELSSYLGEADSIYLSGCSAEIATLEHNDGLRSRKREASLSGIFIPGINTTDYSACSDLLRFQTFFMTPEFQPGLVRGNVDYLPWRYRDILSFYQRKAVDVAVVMLSKPDSEGVCSYGTCADFSPIALPRARIKIGVINKKMPYTLGCGGISLNDLDVVVNIDQPLNSLDRAQPDRQAVAIAKLLGSYVEDNATLQMGLGKIPAAVAEELLDRRNLKVLSGLLDESVLKLEKAGALHPDLPAVGGVALGSEEFYRCLASNPRFSMQPVSVTHNLAKIVRTPSFIAINGALEVDVLGQVNSSVTARGYLAGPGGLPEFVSGALRSKGGRSIVVISAATPNGAKSKIVHQLTGAMPSVGTVDADIVITEHGAAELRGKTLPQRIRAMIGIAAPEHREALERQVEITG